MDDSIKQGMDEEEFFSNLQEDWYFFKFIHSYLEVLNDLCDMFSTFESECLEGMADLYWVLEEELRPLLQRYTKFYAKKLNKIKVVTLENKTAFKYGLQGAKR